MVSSLLGVRSIALACRAVYLAPFVLSAALGLAPEASAGPAAAPPRAVDLTDGWLFQPDPLRVGDTQRWQRPDFERGRWQRVAVPMAWDAYDAVMDGYEGVCWYARQLPADQVVAGAWQRLRFGRVHHHATIWIDGVQAGEDSLGYLPFEVDASPFLTPGRSAWIVVRVENGARYDWLPGTTIVEWVQYGGLLQPVTLLTTPETYLAHASIDASPRDQGGRAAIVVEIRNPGKRPFQGRVRVEACGQSVEAGARVGPGREGRVALELSLPHARWWSPESPALYDARVLLFAGREAIDSLSDRFGVRSVSTRGRQILLNGRPLRIRGVNRYDEFPGRGAPVSEEAIRADLEAVKASGANLVRVHYPQLPATLRIADEIGLLYMEEVPLNWWRASWHPPAPAAFQNDRIIDAAELALERMVRRDGNHPSVIAWSMANECRSDDSLGVHAMERLLRRAKALDSSRLATYVANRAFDQNRAFASADFVAVNLYYGMWDGAVAERIGDIDSLVFRPTRERLAAIARLFPDKPVLLSEFGTIGIPGAGGDVRFSEDYQAAYVTAVWQAVEEVPEISGGIVWSWADYRHRPGFTNDFPTYFGPFGLVRFDRTPKRALAALRAAWTASPKTGAMVPR